MRKEEEQKKNWIYVQTEVEGNRVHKIPEPQINFSSVAENLFLEKCIDRTSILWTTT